MEKMTKVLAIMAVASVLITTGYCVSLLPNDDPVVITKYQPYTFAEYLGDVR